MCGFVGFIDGPDRIDSPGDVIRRMMATIEHRGPDDEGVWHDEAAGVRLGFRRLAILDLSQAGHQPMVSPSGRFVIVFNGEVYNFRQLRAQLAEDGFSFRGHSDTEVMLAAFERWGPLHAVRRFRGMFAFALWDTETRELWLARDRMGIKPLFVAQSGKSLVFGSELRTVLAHPGIQAKGDVDAAWHYLQSLYVPGPLTIIDGVQKVRPGTLVRFSVGASGVEGREETTFWSLVEIANAPERGLRDGTEALDELHDLLREAVRLRLIADVPIGALLSGGIDSSLVVALMAEQSEEAVRTFTIRFDDPRFDEGPISAEVAKLLGTKHTEVPLPTASVRDLIPALGQITDEPMANPSLLPTLLVCRVARQDVVVALSGDGGDELFGGYNRYLHAPRMISAAQRLPQSLRTILAASLDATSGLPGVEALGSRLLAKGFGAQHSFASRLQRAAGIVGARTEVDAYLELVAVGHRSPPVESGGASPLVDRRAFNAINGSLASRMMLLDQLEYLPDDLLAKVDRASMWTSLEARVPLLDHKVVEYSWQLSDDSKIRNGVSKYPLRAITARYLPKELMERPKMGFTVPLERWLRQDLAEWLGDTLESSRMKSRGLYDTGEVSQLHDRFRRGQGELALPLWTLAVLEDWAEQRGVTFG